LTQDPLQQDSGPSAPGGGFSPQALGTTLGIAGLLVGMVVVLSLAPREMTREQYLALDYFPLEEPKPLAPFALVDHKGEPFTREELIGHWSILFFGYSYCPDVCPTTLALLNRVVGDLAADTNPREPRVILISVDPERDTIEQLAAYVTFFNEQFTGVTGEIAEITALATQLYVPFGKVPAAIEGGYLVDHGANVIVVNSKGEYAGFLRPPHQQEHIVEVMRGLLRP